MFAAVAGQAYRLTCEPLSYLGTEVTLSVLSDSERELGSFIPNREPLVFRWLQNDTESLFVRINEGLTGAYRLTLDTPTGDTNLDGHFNSADLVRVFQAGEYEDQVFANSSWEEGDWNGDGEFNCLTWLPRSSG